MLNIFKCKLFLVLFSEDAYKTQVRIDNEPAYWDILDTAGKVGYFFRSFQSLRPVYALTSNSFTTE